MGGTHPILLTRSLADYQSLDAGIKVGEHGRDAGHAALKYLTITNKGNHLDDFSITFMVTLVTFHAHRPPGIPIDRTGSSCASRQTMRGP